MEFGMNRRQAQTNADKNPELTAEDAENRRGRRANGYRLTAIGYLFLPQSARIPDSDLSTDFADYTDWALGFDALIGSWSLGVSARQTPIGSENRRSLSFSAVAYKLRFQSILFQGQNQGFSAECAAGQ
jgi:hypothetical protein